MSTTAKELHFVLTRLSELGIGYDDAQKLRRISMTLRRWFELECGTGDDRVTLSIEREGENGDGKPMLRRQWRDGRGEYMDSKHPTADREKGARKRLAAIMARYPDLMEYVQGDPRGASLYLLRKSDLQPGDKLDCMYSRGIAVF